MHGDGMGEDRYDCEWAQPGRDRGVIFLKCPTNKHVSAFIRFSKLSPKAQQDVRNRLRMWIQEIGDRRQHHGFNKPYEDCHVFKKGALRLYGFKCHPQTAARFRLCVLVTADTKDQEETDLRILERINGLKALPSVISTLNAFFSGRTTSDEKR